MKTQSQANSFVANSHLTCQCFFKQSSLFCYQDRKLFQTNGKTSNGIRKDLPDEVLFDENFATVTKYLTDNMKPMKIPEVPEWFEKVFLYNIPYGKRVSGLCALSTFRNVVPDASLEELKLAAVFGWCLEVSKTSFLVIDDVMDQSLTRRGRKCWYLQEGVGLNAINDAFLLDGSVYVLLKGHFGNHPCYSDIVDVVHEIIYITSIGQCLDMLSASEKGTPNLDKLTEEHYRMLCHHKTAHVFLCLPVRGALLIAQKGDLYSKDVENILLQTGYFYQMQNDYQDCFGDPSVTGKIGTDIGEGKCSWPVVTALRMAEADDKLVIKENYGRQDPECVERVMDIYRKVDIPGCYAKTKSDSYTSLRNQIDGLPLSHDAVKKLLHDLINSIFKAFQ